MTRKQRHALASFTAKGYDRLATYNSERARGLVHRPDYDEEMAAIQAQFVAEQIAEAERNGWTIVGAP